MDDLDLVDEPNNNRGWFSEVVRTWVPAILLVLVLRTFIVEPFRIPSSSMVPTLQVGDQVVVNKSSYGLWVPLSGVSVPFTEGLWVPPRIELIDWGDPERGDVIVFRFPENEAINYIKRVVGLPGDRIRVEDNRVILNGEPQDHAYVDQYPFMSVHCQPSKLKHFRAGLGGVSYDVLTNAGLPGPWSNWPQGEREFVVPEDSVFVMGDNRDRSEDGRRWGVVRYDQIKGKAQMVLMSWDSCERGLRSDRFFHSLYD